MYRQRLTFKIISTRQKGVTFIELLISIAVLAILVALAAPYFGNYIERQRLVGAAEALHGQVQHAKRTAISNNKNIHLKVDSGSNWSSVYGDEDAAGNPLYGEVNGLPVLVVNSENYPTTEVVNDVVLELNMPGISVIPADSTIEIESPSGWEVVISLSSVGRVNICSDDVSQYPDC